MYCDLPVFERSCFCLPLRKGIIVFGVVSILINILNIAQNSFTIHHRVEDPDYVRYSPYLEVPEELNLVLACATVIFGVVLIYGAHKKLLKYIQAYYYFIIMLVAAETLLDIIDMAMMRIVQVAISYMLPLSIAQLFMNLYLILLIRSLLKRVETSGPQGFDNILQQVVAGEAPVPADRTFDY